MDNRYEPALKKVARPASARINEIGVAPMRFANRESYSLRSRGSEDEMDMVGHQTIRPHRNTCFARLLRQEIAIDLMVAVLKKDCLSPLPTLGYVVREANNHGADSWTVTTDSGVIRRSLQRSLVGKPEIVSGSLAQRIRVPHISRPLFGREMWEMLGCWFGSFGGWWNIGGKGLRTSHISRPKSGREIWGTRIRCSDATELVVTTATLNRCLQPM